ncbi:hybrid sensor histidine kinase/response regulator [Myxococcus sp. K15C18031901]|uniref:sensor histidine kinase n=1 Tax=Myxococcus dinghuensis TaxID=2906761 RepID=UPI0020A7F2C0|nr:hybrid sensor histidine kinase/response regulator [Myxococcus dinghuensis]MCP3103247.1 hybrid sensor histidine kinase/response regulator [Myxococcus dinghuensis]
MLETTGTTETYRPRVLAVDVESAGMERLCSILAPAGYDVLPAGDTNAASRQTADLVLLDVERPGTDGLAAYRRLQAELGAPSVPVLMLTRSSDRQARQQVLEAGVDDILTTEPLDPLELKVRVHTLLELKAHRERGGQRAEALQDPRTRWVEMERLARVGTLAADVAQNMGHIGEGFQRALGHVRSRAMQGLLPDVEELKKLGVAGEQMRLYGQHLLSLGPTNPKDIQRFDLRELVPVVVERLRANGRLNSTVEVTVLLPEDPFAVVFNRRQLEQVLVELLVNASDAVEDVKDRPRRVHVGLELPDLFGDFGPRMFVKDTGIGIFEDELQAVFEPYYTTKSPEKAAGLGLTVARALVESMGGKLTVQSRVNLGSTFTVELPEQTSSW